MATIVATMATTKVQDIITKMMKNN
jgi:hypothetical protein